MADIEVHIDFALGLKRVGTLHRRARPGVEAISFEYHATWLVEGSEVALTGIVNSWSERNLARNSAWAAPGVRNVNDNMTVTV
jgi:hypothetical protein